MLMNLTLADVFAHPESVTCPVAMPSGETLLLRPLVADDVDELGVFLSGLSPQTRHFSIFPSYDRAAALGLCDAINRYDKLRFVVQQPPSGEIVALFEFSFDIPDGDIQRYARQGIELKADTDCRFGPTIADRYQNQSLGSQVFPHIVEVAKKFGKTRMILWGGVLSDNSRAIRFYAKHGFRPVGPFVDYEGLPSLDMMLELADYGGKRSLAAPLDAAIQ